MENDAVQWDFSDGEVSLQVVLEIESKLNIKFPKDYVEVATVYNGGTPSLEAFDFEGREEAVFNQLLSFHSDRDSFIVDVRNDVEDRLVDGIYPFADDPFGNLLCFDYRQGGQPTVVFWDHEVASADPVRALTYVAASFTELLTKLYD
jgi:hypothetical protein